MNKELGRIAVLAFAFAAAHTAHAQVVISQVYGGGGNSGAPLRSDYIELHNNGPTAVDLAGWSVQYASATGTTWQRTNLSGSISPGGYYLVKQADGANASAPALPTPDAIGTIPMAGTAGKVALINSTAALSGACPANVDFVGFGTTANCAEGSAPTANLTNSTAALRAEKGCTDSGNNGADFTVGAPAPRNGASAVFSCSGANLPVLTIADSDADESAGSVVFHLQLSGPAGPAGVTVGYASANGTANAGEDYVARSGSITIPAGETGIDLVFEVINDTLTESDETFFVNLGSASGATLGDAQAKASIVDNDFVFTPIHEIQGNGATSPLVGQRIHTTGIVTARKSNGYFVQTSDAAADLDPATSQGVFVFTSTAPPAAAAIGNLVHVAGSVIEFVPTQDPGQAPTTEISGFATTSVLSTGHALPTPIALTTTFPDPAGPLDQLERVEGMRVVAPSFTVAAPTEGNTSEPNATGTSNGIFHGVVTGVARPFREPGIQAPDPAPLGSSLPPIPQWDFNPELLTVDSDALGGAAFTLNVPAGTVITNLTGPLDYGFRRFTILRDPTVAITVTDGPAPHAARAPTADEFTVAAYNLERFFDTINDANKDDPILTAAAYTKRLNKASVGIRNYLNTPDILGVVEVEKLPVLQSLAERINADAVAEGQPDPQYVAFLEEGNDIGGIDVGLLIKTAGVATGVARVEVVSVTQVGKDTTWIEPDGGESLLNDRPPLVLDAVVHYADGRAFPITVIVVHQRSLNGADEDSAGGDRVRRKRQRQAEFLATLISERQAASPGTRIVTLGDFNAFAFNDGYVDAMNVVAGTPTPDEQTVVPGDGIDLIDPDLVNLGELAAPGERYSFVFGGNAQTLDHVLVNEELVVMTRSAAADHARINADFPEINRNDAASPSRLADHDPVVAYFVPRNVADLGVTATAASNTFRVGETMAFNASVTNFGPDAADHPGVGFALDGELSTMAVTAPNGWTCDAPQINAGKTSIACNTTALADGAIASFTVTVTATQAMVGTTVNFATAVDAQSFDSVPGNDQASANATVFALADLGVSLSGPSKHLRSTTVGRYRVVLASAAGGDAAPQSSLVLTGDAPAANVAMNAPQGWTCAVTVAAGGFEANCSGGTFAADATAVFDLAIVAPPRVGDGTLTVVATAASIANDPNPGNNTAVHSVRLIGSPK
jgi:predicted extracellular nuclease